MSLAKHPNPYVRHFLGTQSFASDRDAQFGEKAWDAAIAAVLSCKDKKGKISVGKVKELMSTKQRVNGPAVPLDASRTPTRDMSISELNGVVANMPERDRLEFEALVALVSGMIPAVKHLREKAAVSLKSAADYVRHLREAAAAANAA